MSYFVNFIFLLQLIISKKLLYLSQNWYFLIIIYECLQGYHEITGIQINMIPSV